MIEVLLTTAEMVKYGAAGVARCAHALTKRRQGAHGFDRNDERWTIDVEGCLAEAAAAKSLGLIDGFEPTVGHLDTDEGDIGPGLQVRSTKYDKGNLLIHQSDPDHHAYILVTGRYGVYDVRGWIRASEGKLPELWKVNGKRGAFWVPQDRLHAMDELAATL